MNYRRHLISPLTDHFRTYRQAIVLIGARQVGKTTLLRHVFPDARYLLVDNEQTRRVLESYDLNTYSQILGNEGTVIIDELHLLTDPGRAVKILYDQLPGIRLIVTGSSALHIKNRSSESLAGRKISYQLYPLTFSEYLVQKGIEAELDWAILDRVIEQTPPPARLFVPSDILRHLLVYGSYPETLSLGDPRPYLLELADSAVFKDIVELDLINDRSKARQLLKLLAYQIGNLVNYSEIGARLGLDRRTVERYIDIFEQSFILFRLYPFSRRARDEIGKAPKVYFHDLGLRNALIDNFDTSLVRADLGAMFENFIISEIKRALSYSGRDLKIAYWRTKAGAEVDLVLSSAAELYGVEIKWHKSKLSAGFHNRYPEAQIRVVTSETFY